MADPINILSLCSGVGMLDLGVAAGLDYLGFAPRHVGYCERDAYAASCLMARMEDASLEPAPVFCGDMRDLDALPLRGRVDLVCAGLPCQPYSTAGKQRGLDDHRSYGDGDGPIPHFLRIVAECRPALVFCENVPPWVRGGWFRPVGEELCRLGYGIARPIFVTAESVGASHRRERVFMLAYAASINDRQRRHREGSNEAVETRTRNEWGHRIAAISGEMLADAERIGGGAGQLRWGAGRGIAARRTSETVGYANGEGPQGRGPGLAERRGEPVASGRDGADVALFAPGPGDPRWPGILQDAPWLAPAISEEETQREVRRVFDGLSDKLDGGLGDARKIRSCEVLRRLWEAIGEEAHKRASRRSWRFRQAEILRTLVHGESHDKAGCRDFQGASAQASAEVEGVLLRALRDIGQLASRSQGPQPVEQRPGQSADAVRQLPHEDAPCARRDCEICRASAVPCVREEIVSGRFVQYLSDSTAAIWKSISPSSKAWVAMDSDSSGREVGRADQLRCGGNGCVPLQAAVAIVELMREVMP